MCVDDKLLFYWGKSGEFAYYLPSKFINLREILKFASREYESLVRNFSMKIKQEEGL